MVFGIYCRKSVLSEKGESVENQAEMCKEYIIRKFGEDNNIVIYEDDGFSGKNTERPMFKKMMEDIKNRHLNYVICYRLDRISRSVSDFSYLVEMMNGCKTGLICIKEEFDTSRPMGKAMMYMASVFAQLERETIGERVRDNMLMLSKGGRWLGGNTPLGYHSEKIEYINEEGRSKYACYLKEDKRLIIPTRIFQLYLKYENVSKTTEKINKEGYRTKNGKPFTNYYVRNILTNPVYCKADKHAFDYFNDNNIELFGECCEYGLLAYNKINKDSEIIAVGRHKPAVSGKEWAYVQEKLSCNKRYYQKQLMYGKSLASGVMVCGLCGGRMLAINRNDKFDYDYICENKRKYHKCLSKNANGRKADKEIKEYMIAEKMINEKSDIFELKKTVRECLEISWTGKDIEIKKTL